MTDRILQHEQALIKNISPTEKALETNINRMVTPTGKGFENALNKNGFIGFLDDDFLNKIDFSGGNVHLKNDRYQKFNIGELKSKEVIPANFDYTLLKGLYSIVFQTKESIDNAERIIIHRKALSDFLGKNTRGGLINDFLQDVKSFKNCYGFLPNGSIYNLITFIKYEAETELFYFDVSFILKLIEIQRTEKVVNKKENKVLTHYNQAFLIHSNIAKERNKIAVFMVEVIVTLLTQAGKIKNPSISCQTIIDRVPQLKEVLQEAKLTANTRQQKNILLKRHFSQMYKLLKTKTDVYKYFANFTINEVIPTVTTINSVISINHNGKIDKNGVIEV